jgi:hypothetical protein
MQTVWAKGNHIWQGWSGLGMLGVCVGRVLLGTKIQLLGTSMVLSVGTC